MPLKDQGHAHLRSTAPSGARQFAYAGGAFTDHRVFNMGAILVQHPKGDVLFDAGIDAARLRGVILSHAHLDHISGLDELAGVPVWLNQHQWDFVNSGHRSTALARQLTQADRRMYAFESGPYLGFAASHDRDGYGSVVPVWAPGHTPGSIIAFIHTPGLQIVPAHDRRIREKLAQAWGRA